MDILQFSTSELDAPERSSAIEHTFSNFLFMDIDIPTNKSPILHMKALGMKELSITTMSGTGAKAVRTSEHASRSTDDVILCITQHADVRIQKSKGSPEVYNPGEPHVWRADQRFSCEVNGDYSTLMLSVPGAAYDRVNIDPERVLHDETPSNSPTLNLLTSYANTFVREMGSLSQDIIEVTARHMQELAVIALGSARERSHLDTTKSIGAARLVGIKEDIENNLTNPELSAHWVAMKAGISPRYLRDLFRLEQTNFTEYVLERRMVRAYKRLSTPQFVTCSISTIAYEVGFNDLSYFGRVFKRRFGATPSDIRNSDPLNKQR